MVNIQIRFYYYYFKQSRQCFPFPYWNLTTLLQEAPKAKRLQKKKSNTSLGKKIRFWFVFSDTAVMEHINTFCIETKFCKIEHFREYLPNYGVRITNYH